MPDFEKAHCLPRIAPRTAPTDWQAVGIASGFDRGEDLLPPFRSRPQLKLLRRASHQVGPGSAHSLNEGLVDIDDPPGRKIGDHARQRVRLEEAGEAGFAGLESGVRAVLAQAARKQEPERHRRQRIDDDHGGADAEQDLEAGAPAQQLQDQEHHDMHDEAQAVKLAPREVGQAFAMEAPPEQAEGRRREDHADPRQGGRATEVQPVGRREQHRDERGDEAEVQPAHRQQHRAGIEDDVRHQPERRQHDPDAHHAQQQANADAGEEVAPEAEPVRGYVEDERQCEQQRRVVDQGDEGGVNHAERWGWRPGRRWNSAGAARHGPAAH